MTSLTREALYALVWSEPVRDVAARFGVSDVGFKKQCADANVPFPQRGYWAKVAAGKPALKPPLPAREPGQSELVYVGKARDRFATYRPPADLSDPLPDPPTFSEPLEQVRERVAPRLARVPFVRDLASPHPAIRRLLEADAARAEKLRTNRWAWDKPYFEGGFETRRLKILNSLALGLAKVGVKLQMSGKVARDITFVVGQMPVHIRLDHPNAKPNQHGEWQVREGPADKLQLTIEPPERSGVSAYPVFVDGEDKLETRLREIAVEIVVAGEAEHRLWRAKQHRWLVADRERLEAETRKRREEEEARALAKRLAQEKARRDLLFRQAHAWRTAHDIRGFVAEVLAAGEPSEERRRWADWALAEADALDPTKAGALQIAPSDEAVSDP